MGTVVDVDGIMPDILKLMGKKGERIIYTIQLGEEGNSLTGKMQVIIVLALRDVITFELHISSGRRI